MIVTKRDGRQVEFDKDKIVKAISKAFVEVYSTVTDEMSGFANKVATEISSKEADMTVEEIQDIVTKKLMLSRYKDVARRYIEYRYLHHLVRESNTTDKSIKELIDGENDYWNTENSNKNPRIVTTQRDYIAGITSTDIARRFLLPPEIVKAHDEGILHFHDMDYFAQKSLHNCFSGDTKLVTDLGVRSFNSFADGAVIKVKDKNGVWREATVKKYGKQKMFDVTFKTPKSEKTVTCTQNHRWILDTGEVTTNLRVGDKLFPLTDSASNYVPSTLEELRAFCFGFVLGDGCDCSDKGVQVRLCNNKNEYLEYFIKAGYKYYQVTNSNDYVAYNRTEYSKQSFLNNNAWKLLSLDQKIALFHGYYCADGRKNNHSISTTDNRLMTMIEEISALAGYYIGSKFEEHRHSNYVEDFSITTYSFIIEQKAKNWLWTVKEIKPHYNKKYKDNRQGRENSFKTCNPAMDAWCVEEPVTHTFTLSNGMVTGNCELVNLEDMLQNGTVINGVKIDKPHRLLTAATIATQIITAVTSSSYGGCSINLSHLAPFVRDSYEYHKNKYLKRGMNELDAEAFAGQDTDKEVSDAVQTFNYQVNSMTNTNGQAPFLSVFMYINDNIEYRAETVTLIAEFLRQRMIGFKNEVGHYVTPAFPKLLYVLDENNCEPNTEYWWLTKLAAECTAKRMVPDYISAKIMKRDKIDANGNGNVFACMGCRSFLTPYLDSNNNPKYWGRFNQGVVTINLPDVALSSKGDKEKFWQLFDERLELCHKAMQCRHERLAIATSDVAPILWQHGALARLPKGASIHPLLHGGYSTLSLGYAGLYECVKYMTGESHSHGKGKEFGLAVMQHLNDKCNEWKEAEDIAYSPYGSPIESTTYKFAKCLKKRFGVIEGITDKDYITNSYHINVREEIDPFSKLAIEAEYQKLSQGGAISYIECADLTNNIPAVLEVIKFIYNNIMYAELNTKSDYCQVCGYDGEIEIVDNDGTLSWRCPNCGNTDQTKMNVARRTCGYIGSQFWNQGRTQEIKERYVHLDNHEMK